MGKRSKSGSTLLEVTICLCIVTLLIKLTLTSLQSVQKRQPHPTKCFNVYERLSPIIRKGQQFKYTKNTFSVIDGQHSTDISTHDLPGQSTPSLHLPAHKNAHWQYWSRGKAHWRTCGPTPKRTRSIRLQILEEDGSPCEEVIFTTAFCKLYQRLP